VKCGRFYIAEDGIESGLDDGVVVATKESGVVMTSPDNFIAWRPICSARVPWSAR